MFFRTGERGAQHGKVSRASGDGRHSRQQQVRESYISLKCSKRVNAARASSHWIVFSQKRQHLISCSQYVAESPKGRHVLAAVACGAQTIVTFNLKDFPPEALAPWNVKAQSPDEFLIHQYHVDPAAVFATVGQHAEKHGNWERLMNIHGGAVPEFVSLLLWSPFVNILVRTTCPEKMGVGAMFSVVSLAAVVQNQGWGLLSAAAAAAPIASAYLDYRKDVKRHPAFFLWKALGKNAKKRP
ncbi:MAG: hypothetical protein WBG54_07240 [Acidobacteriaceae bacterium]